MNITSVTQTTTASRCSGFYTWFHSIRYKSIMYCYRSFKSECVFNVCFGSSLGLQIVWLMTWTQCWTSHGTRWSRCCTLWRRNLLLFPLRTGGTSRMCFAVLPRFTHISSLRYSCMFRSPASFSSCLQAMLLLAKVKLWLIPHKTQTNSLWICFIKSIKCLISTSSHLFATLNGQVGFIVGSLISRLDDAVKEYLCDQFGCNKNHNVLKLHELEVFLVKLTSSLKSMTK